MKLSTLVLSALFLAAVSEASPSEGIDADNEGDKTVKSGTSDSSKVIKLEDVEELLKQADSLSQSNDLEKKNPFSSVIRHLTPSRRKEKPKQPGSQTSGTEAASEVGREGREMAAVKPQTPPPSDFVKPHPVKPRQVKPLPAKPSQGQFENADESQLSARQVVSTRIPDNDNSDKVPSTEVTTPKNPADGKEDSEVVKEEGSVSDAPVQQESPTTAPSTNLSAPTDTTGKGPSRLSAIRKHLPAITGRRFAATAIAAGIITGTVCYLVPDSMVALALQDVYGFVVKVASNGFVACIDSETRSGNACLDYFLAGLGNFTIPLDSWIRFTTTNPT